MILPLEKRLKKRLHIEIARLQDEVVEILYGVENDLVFHGGTAIWRCYQGNRFSEDLDFYCKNIEKVERQFREKISERGLTVLKFKKTANLVFCKISNGSTEIRVEINYAVKKKAVVKNYEKTDGSLMDVFTLSPEELVLEKIGAYENRRFIRDIYDIYHLSNYLTEREMVKKEVVKLLALPKLPADEKNLKAIVYAGKIPSFKQILEELRRRFA
ncbi:MAG: nucleotidyl transferase AbiEii/AbiGii toxin family protein [Candidatus Micrarchaeota archaeon]